MAHPFYTIGHGKRTIEEFVALLGSVEVNLLVDVRTMPRSRFNPQYNQDALPETLKPFGIGYEHIAALGGLRGKTREIEPATNAYWDNDSFHNYADYAMGRARSFARARRDAALRHHVRGDGVVALSSPHHHRLPAGCGRAGLPHPGAGQDRARRDERGRAAAGKGCAGLSGAAAGAKRPFCSIARHASRRMVRKVME
jgi:hypothetical protein